MRMAILAASIGFPRVGGDRPYSTMATRTVRSSAKLVLSVASKRGADGDWMKRTLGERASSTLVRGVFWGNPKMAKALAIAAKTAKWLDIAARTAAGMFALLFVSGTLAAIAGLAFMAFGNEELSEPTLAYAIWAWSRGLVWMLYSLPALVATSICEKATKWLYERWGNQGESTERTGRNWTVWRFNRTR